MEIGGSLIGAGGEGVNIRKSNGVSAFLASPYGYSELLAFLFSVNREDVGVPVSATRSICPLMVACGSGHVESVRILKGNRASLEIFSANDGEVLLITAVRSDNLKVVDMLLSSRASNFDACFEAIVFTPFYLSVGTDMLSL